METPREETWEPYIYVVMQKGVDGKPPIVKHGPHIKMATSLVAARDKIVASLTDDERKAIDELDIRVHPFVTGA